MRERFKGKLIQNYLPDRKEIKKTLANNLMENTSLKSPY